MRSPLVLPILLGLSAALVSASAVAHDASSASFQLFQGEFVSAAGSMTSPSYRIRGALAGPSAETMASANFLVRGGFVDASDPDADGIPSAVDNCQHVANIDQADADAGFDDDSSKPGDQSYGDACDADIDDDGIVGATDFFGSFRPCLGAVVATTPACTDSDLDGDGVVGPSDFFGVLRPAFGTAPGPGRDD